MSTQLNETVANSFCTAADTLIQRAVNSAEFDKTISAEIVEVIDASIGKYKVKYQDALFYAYSENTNATYRKGIMVQVLIPKGDMSYEYKTILGATARLGSTYLSESETEAIYVKNGRGCLENISLFFKISDIQALPNNSQTIYPGTLVTINEDEVKQYLRNSSNMLFSCQLKTEIDGAIRRKGKYGIRITLEMESDTIKPDGQETLKVFEFDTDDVVGTPYNLPVWTNQEKVFDFDKGNFENIKKIEIFAEGFETNKGDGIIYFQDLNIFGANMLSADQVVSGQVTIATPKGKYFNDTVKELELEAKVYFAGKLASQDEQNYDIFWFRKNALVNSEHEKYHAQYGKIGWACLNDKAGDQWISADSVLTLNDTDFKAKETMFKCVVVSAGQQYSSEITIYNSNAIYNFTISPSQSVYFTNDIGSILLKVQNNEADIDPKDNFKFQWMKTDISKTSTIIKDSEDKIINSSQLTVEAKDINIQNTYDCTIYSDGQGELLGTAQIILYNEARAPEYTLVIVNGKQTFKYDNNGYSPTHAANEHQTPILPLSFEIYDKKGQKVKDDIVAAKCQNTTRWLIPKASDNSLLDTNGYTNEELDPVQMHWIKRDLSFEFKIKDRYSYSANQNQIQLEVDYVKDDGTKYPLTAITEFVFVKEGMQGTNGTENGVCWISSEKPFLEINNIDTKSKTLTGNPSGGTFQQLSRTIDNISNSSWISMNGSTVTADKLPKNFPSNEEVSLLAHIIQYKVIDNQTQLECSNTLPVVVTYYSEEGKNNYRFNLKPYTGFLNVQYETNGKYPKYDMDKPFEIECQKKNQNGEFKDLTNLEELTFTWYCSSLLTKQTENLNQYRAIPAEKYDSYSYIQAVWVLIKNKNDNALAIIHIPVYFYLNKYSNADINAWNGNGIEIKEDSGIILSPQVGAGKKNDDNTFTGVIIGTKEKHITENESTSETGLFGYNHGQQTIFLDAETGKSEFGASGEGQIIIDPTDIDKETGRARARIYSGNFYKNVETEEEAGKGLLIDLTTPEIRFGSGNFKVNKDGHIVAKGGGTIAGWKINDDAIFSKKQTNDKDSTSHQDAAVGMSSASSGENARVGDFNNLGRERELAFWAGGNKFMVSHDGVLKAVSAVIGGGNPSKNSDVIYIGASGDNSAIYSGKTSFKDGTNNGFYLGADGLSIGKTIVALNSVKNQSAFEVSKDGDVCFRSGKIGFDGNNPDFNSMGTSHNYWTIDGKAIKYNQKTGYNSGEEGIYIGTDGIGFGKREFYVDVNGKVTGADMTVVNGGFKIVKRTYNSDGSYIDSEPSFQAIIDENKKSLVIADNIRATGGTIGGWKINAHNIAANGLILSDTGTINANYKAGTSGWQIEASGNAYFNNITANSGTIGGITINKNGLGGLYAGNGGATGTGVGFSIGKNGTISASGATIGGQLTAETFNFINGPYYMNMGIYTSHPNASGINIGKGGIKVKANPNGSGGKSGQTYARLAENAGDARINVITSLDSLKLKKVGSTLYATLDFKHRRLEFTDGIITEATNAASDSLTVSCDI